MNRIEWWPAPREGVDRYALDLAVAESAMVERAVEMAAQTGTCGVRVWRYDEGVTVEVDSTVPYGHIYEMPHGQRPLELSADHADRHEEWKP